MASIYGRSREIRDGNRCAVPVDGLGLLSDEGGRNEARRPTVRTARRAASSLAAKPRVFMFSNFSQLAVRRRSLADEGVRRSTLIGRGVRGTCRKVSARGRFAGSSTVSGRLGEATGAPTKSLESPSDLRFSRRVTCAASFSRTFLMRAHTVLTPVADAQVSARLVSVARCLRAGRRPPSGRTWRPRAGRACRGNGSP